MRLIFMILALSAMSSNANASTWHHIVCYATVDGTEVESVVSKAKGLLITTSRPAWDGSIGAKILLRVDSTSTRSSKADVKKDAQDIAEFLKKALPGPSPIEPMCSIDAVSSAEDL